MPAGFRFTYARRSPQGGFRTNDELLLLYGSPRDPGMRPMPVQIYLTKEHQAALSGTNDADPTEISATVGGRIVPIEYWDGTWRPDRMGTHTAPNGVRVSWTTNNGHVVVGRVGDFLVGVRGYRSSGITKADLCRILESMA
jgi:hypothetical protein